MAPPLPKESEVSSPSGFSAELDEQVLIGPGDKSRVPSTFGKSLGLKESSPSGEDSSIGCCIAVSLVW